ncbi:Gfo/Idh/MocA family protein [Lapidilactobacillus mulanensis]|uniref:Gfo/Idh/MocA family protein n=1 Tax=Lapidilactobacillus mulanensis TaxID=2485999 RepID=A0ABW4DQI0_9LACO|nr:Gfo/Idh/MocA family oxidoreductase [Lapidilactobacillus mulanensis]
MLRVGIIGLGTISAVHLAVIRKSAQAELVAACDIDASKAADAPDCHFYQDVEEMLSQEKLDVVHLCLPHYLHVPMALLANRYHCHVLTEKPLGLSVADGERLVHPENPEYKIAVCFQNRFNQTTIKLQNILAETQAHVIGGKGLVIWNRGQDYYDASPWRGTIVGSGGTLSNQSIHTIDLLQLFCGPFVDCRAQLLHLTDMKIEVEDSSVANLHFQNNVRAYFNSTNSYVTDSSVELEIVTTDSKFEIRDGELTETLKDGECRLLASDMPNTEFKSYYGSSHGRLIEAFYQSILENTSDYISVPEALKSLAIIDAMVQSSEDKDTVNVTR